MDTFVLLSIFIICFAPLISIFVYIQNYGVQKTHYKIDFENLPKEFNGYKILHLSDIHRKSFGKNQRKLISLIESEKPDLIVVSGDIIYCYNHWYNFYYDYAKDLKKVIKIFEAICKNYPVYYSPGNHECKSGYYKEVKSELLKCGVVVLDSGLEIIKREEKEIALIGLKDPTFWGGSNLVIDEYIQKTQNELLELKNQTDGRFTVLISHRPEIFEIYKEAKVDVVFSGHAHGGQWVFPIVGPVFAPQQGYFPKYTVGVHEFDKTKLVINRGLGNSSMPIRLFNRPEVVITTISKK